MPVEPSPAFQFYPKDFLSDDKVMAMNATACGVYMRLLCHCWLNGSIPNDPADLRRMAHYEGKMWSDVWRVVSKCFIPSHGRLINLRIERERQKQAHYRELKRNAGLASANRRSTEDQQTVNRQSTHTPTESNPPSPSPSPSPSPIVSTKNKLTSTDGDRPNGNGHGVLVPSKAPPLKDEDDPLLKPEVTTRAAAFIEHYAQLYPKHRHGARYTIKPGRDWEAAVTLCNTWEDDERLNKLAICFLTTDHQFAAKGSRTIGQFLALASWVDGELAEWEKKHAAG